MSSMPEEVLVTFLVNCAGTSVGQHVRAVGSSTALGRWNPSQGLMLSTSNAEFPTWKSVARIKIEEHVEYKYVICGKDGMPIRWEDGRNRSMQLSSPSLASHAKYVKAGSIALSEVFNGRDDTDEKRFGDPLELPVCFAADPPPCAAQNASPALPLPEEKKVERSPEQRKLYEAVEKKKGYVDLSNQKIEDVILLAKALKANTSIKTLKLASNRIQDISALADALKTNTNLIKLDLSYNEIKDVSTLVKVLKTRTSLQWLSLSKNAIQVENQKEIKMVCAEKKIKLEI